MLTLQDFFRSLNKLHVTVEKQAECFGVSTTTISYWITGKRNPKKPEIEIFEGVERCRAYLRNDEDTFIFSLIKHLGLSDREVGLLESQYSLQGYTTFLHNLIHLCIRKEPIVPSAMHYVPACTVRPVLGIGQFHILAVKSNGRVLSAGSNEDQQRNVSSWKNVISVAGSWKGSVALCSDGTCVATGLNVIGSGEIFRWTDIVSIACGPFHVLGLKFDGSVESFGRAGSGQCNVNNWRGIQAVACGNNHSVGLQKDGNVIAIGQNNYGQCEVTSWSDIIQIAASGDHTVGLRSDGTVVATGDIDLFRFNQWKGITAVATGMYHLAALKKDGTVVNTGHTVAGQDEVQKWHNIIAISADYYTTVGLRSDGKVFSTNSEYSMHDNYMDVGDWRLFENKKIEIDESMSKYYLILEKFQQSLKKIKAQADKCSVYVNQFHDGIATLDFSPFASSFEYLYYLSKDVWEMHTECSDLPTIDQQIMLYSIAYTNFLNTVEKITIDGNCFTYQLTETSYNNFVEYFTIMKQVDRDVRDLLSK